MKNSQKILYRVATLWLTLGMTSTAIVQLIGVSQQKEMFIKLGYPAYVMTLLGVWKLLGVVAVLLPKKPLLKEWAYAGFFFSMTGAIYSHIYVHDAWLSLFGPVLLTILTLTSWYLRPADRKL